MITIKRNFVKSFDLPLVNHSVQVAKLLDIRFGSPKLVTIGLFHQYKKIFRKDQQIDLFEIGFNSDIVWPILLHSQADRYIDLLYNDSNILDREKSSFEKSIYFKDAIALAHASNQSSQIPVDINDLNLIFTKVESLIGCDRPVLV